MLRLGVTGGIGSGKSTVCQLFEHLGVPVYYADQRAKEIVNEDPEIRNRLTEAFGEKTFINGIYNRSHVASIVFNDKSKLEIINGIIHPAVFKDWEKFCKHHQDKPYIVKEAAIMLETDSKQSIDKIALVYAPLELRLERVMTRDGADKEAIMARINSQMPEEEKLKLADHVIINDGTKSVIQQVLALHQQYSNPA